MSKYGRIQYTVSTGDGATPRRSPYHSADIYGAGNLPWSATANAGDTQDIYLDWGYTSLDPVRHGTRHASITPIGFSEVISHGIRKGHKFQLEFVAHIRKTGLVDDFAVMEALNDHLEAGSALWWPDYTNFPTESVTVVGGRIIAPKRVDKRELFNFVFDFDELPIGQAPTTVPPFV